MVILKIVGSPEVLSRIQTDGKKSGQIWSVDAQKPLGSQLPKLKRTLNIDDDAPGFRGYRLHAVSGGGRGAELRLEETTKAAQARLGAQVLTGGNGPSAGVWIETAADDDPPAPEPAAAAPEAKPPEAKPPAKPPPPPPEAKPPPPPPPEKKPAPAPAPAAAPAAPPPPREEAKSPAERTPPQRPSSPRAAGTPELYEAAAMGWVPLRRIRGADGEEVVEVPVPAREAEAQLRHAAQTGAPLRVPGRPLCPSCCALVLRQDPARVVWGAVDEYPAPVLPNTNYKEGWVFGKMKYTRGSDGRWKKGTFVDWKDRFFRVTPTGLHYYSTDVLHGKDQWKAKSSYPFTQSTELIADPPPSEAEFKEVGKDRGNFHYFGLKFRQTDNHDDGCGDVALLMRMRTEKEMKEWTRFLTDTLEKLEEDKNWASRTRPVEMKAVCSNRLARVADMREAAHDAYDAAEDDRQWGREAAAAAAAARAEHEHLLRAADRSEGVVASTMARIRELQEGVDDGLAAAQQQREEALRDVTDAQDAKKRAAARRQQLEREEQSGESDRARLRRRTEAILAERDAAVDERRRLFARWRKMEERGQAALDPAPAPRGATPLAFSPESSPWHPARAPPL